MPELSGPTFDFSHFSESLNLTEQQPLYPFVEISIGGYTVTDYQDDISDTLMDFVYYRNTETIENSAGNKFELTLYDDTAIQIESILYSAIEEMSSAAATAAANTAPVSDADVDMSADDTVYVVGEKKGKGTIHIEKDSTGSNTVNLGSSEEKFFNRALLSNPFGDVVLGDKKDENTNTTLKPADVFLNRLESMSQIMQKDAEEGNPWKYSNSYDNTKGSFNDNLNSGNRYCNASTLYKWALEDSGIKADPSNVKGNYEFSGFFDSYSGKGKTQKELIKEGLLKPGDIVSYVGSTDVNVYAGNGKFYDAGRIWSGDKEGSEYSKLFGDQSDRKVSLIRRLRDDVSVSEPTTSGLDASSFSDEPFQIQTTFGGGIPGISTPRDSSSLGADRNINIRYGWVGHGGTVLEETSFVGMFMEYSIEFEGASTILTIEGAVHTVQEAGAVGVSEYPASVYNGVPSDVVNKICEDENIEKGKIEPTKPMLDDEGNPKSFVRNMESAIEFIQKSLCEEATSLKGSVGYKVFYGTDGKLNYVPKSNSKKSNIKINASSSSKENRREVDKNAAVEVLASENSFILGVGTASTVIIGDSRSVGMYAAKNGRAGSEVYDLDRTGVGWSCKTGAGLDDLQKGLWNKAKGYVGSGTNIIINMGVNDLYNANGYANYINNVIVPYARSVGANVTFCSVNPVVEGKGGYSVTNSQIEAFNNKMRGSGVNYLDTYSQLQGAVNSSSSSDGLHYNNSLSKKVYDMMTGNGTGMMGAGDFSNNPMYSESGSMANAMAMPTTFNVTRHYEFYSGRLDNRVINFSPDVKDMSIMGGVTDTVSVDNIRNQILSAMAVDDAMENRGQYVVMGKSSSSIQSLADCAANLRNSTGNKTINATLEIVGDPTIEINSFVYISVYTKYGILHHTSGLYQIIKGEDAISDGGYTTTLTLRRMTTGMLTGQAPVNQMMDNTGNDNYPMASSAVKEGATRFALGIAADPSHGYSNDPNLRWGPEYDCSSLVITAYKKQGVNFDATYTGNMYKGAMKAGFMDVTSMVDLRTGAGLQRGDILLDVDNHGHTAMYIGNGEIVHARGQSMGSPALGDQGQEISKGNYYRGQWQYVLRYGG